ncbi:RNA polymerase sigma factor [Marinibaculum pumilum]|uniref:RNA polymerase sigma factor n=1 Tax=Marinibaculum pumilum TaxID=1766165 RepID=A0ABV7L7J7_9PROT
MRYSGDGRSGRRADARPGYPELPSDRNRLHLFVAHRSALVSYAHRILGDRGHAEDVVQEAFLRFDNAAPDADPAEPLAYLYRIVRNLSVDVQRRLHRDRARQHPDAERLFAAVQEDRPAVEQEVAARQELRALAAALEELPPKVQAAVRLHRFEGCTIRQIAAQLDVSVGQAHALVIQGLEHCRARLHRR